MARMALCTLLFAGLIVSASVGDSVDIVVGETDEHEVRFVSGKTIYVEGLVDSRWADRYRASDGRINFPYWKYTEPAFEMEMKENPNAEEGIRLDKGWQWVCGKELSKTDRGARHFVVELESTLKPVTLKVHTLLNGTPVLVRWLEVTNNSEKPLALTKVYPWSGRLWASIYGLSHNFTALCSGLYQWQPLAEGTTVVESALSSNGFDEPFFIVRNEEKGSYFIGHMAWSDNFRMEFECNKNGSDPKAGLSFKIGPRASAALRVIDPGETIQTPAVHLGHVDGDLDTAVQAMHTHLRRFVLPPGEKNSYLIQYAVPSDQGYYCLRQMGAGPSGNGFNEANMFKSIDIAAAVGAELFLMDVGWYDIYGQWVPSSDRFPRGLESIVEYAYKKGLLFGLQTEVEGGRGNWKESKLFKEHPDWFRPRNEMDMTRPEVVSYMEAELCKVIDRYQLDLYRHEYILGPSKEAPMTLRWGFQENDSWRYYEGFTRFWSNIRMKYPHLILQQCANGGSREDIMAQQLFHETYTTEAETPRFHHGYAWKTLSLPPEILVYGLGTSPEGGPLDTHLRSTFTLATPWMITEAPSVEEMSPERIARYRHYTDIYKNFIRPLLPTCKVYHHTPFNSHKTDDPWFAMEFAAPNRKKAWALIVHLYPTESDAYIFKPRGLDPGKKYRVTFDNKTATSVIDGSMLQRDGLAIRLEAARSSELLLFEVK